ncbi:MAG: tetraacyldisaccharide 4'-kinase [Rhodospirillaceae bacterium]|nr:tetraacyldisaccharide 4'-kinase [Rhodospirillaceae bacterium]
MQAPGFWQHGKGGVLAQLLSPLGWVYGFATKAKLATTIPWKSPVPVLCIGNLTAGGAGKTPVALDLGKRLIAKGKTVHFLSRGYGGCEKGPLLVDPDVHDHTSVGDEPLLLSIHAPAWVSRVRRSGCEAAARAGADLIIMDDGFQNPYIHKNFSVIVIDGGYGFGNAKMIPAGPLRESIASGLARADSCVVIGEDTTGTLDIASSCGLSPLRARFIADALSDDAPTGPVVAFTGIGRPEKFFETVTQMGHNVVSTIPFPDHHPYNNADINTLRQIATKAGAQLLTTEKDAQRLPASFIDDVTVIPVSLEWTDEGALDALLNGICNA